jgi:hypothetical protein
MRRRQSPFLRPSTKSALGRRYETFRLENQLVRSQSLFNGAALTVSPLDLLYSGDVGNHDVGGHFHHFGIFSSLAAMMIKFV